MSEAEKTEIEEKKELVEHSEYGEARKPDPEFRGPMKERSCTDVLCLVLLIIFFLVSVVVFVTAYSFGNPQNLIYAKDSQGNTCGQDAFKDRPNLFIFDIVQCITTQKNILASESCSSAQVCLASCPNITWIAQTAQDTPEQRRLMICQYNVNPMTDSRSMNALVSQGACAAYYYPEDSILGRCLPFELLREAGQRAANNSNDPRYENVQALGIALKALAVVSNSVQDVMNALPLLAAAALLAILFSFLWIVIVNYLAGCIIWIVIFSFFVVFLAGSAFSWYMYAIINQALANSTTGNISMFSTGNANLNEALNNNTTWLISGIVFTVIFVVVIILVCVLYERIKIAVSIIGQTSKATVYMFEILFWPLVPMLFSLLVIAYSLLCAVNIASVEPFSVQQARNESGKICTPGNDSFGANLCNVIITAETTYSIWVQLFNLFIFFWLFNFVDAISDITLAGAYARYYFSLEKPKDIPPAPLLGAFHTTVRYHLGSAAFGALLIAIVQTIRAVLMYIQESLRGKDNAVASFLLKCLSCCFWLIEKILKFITRNAYIMIAIRGKNFCISAIDSFSLIMRNILRATAVGFVTWFLLFIGKLVVVGILGVLTFLAITNNILLSGNVTYVYIPILLVVLIAFIISSLFFSVYEMGVDTIFLCFLEDLEMNDGSPERPFFMSKDLKELLHKENSPA